MNNLWIKNTPADFWKLDLQVSADEWEEAARSAYPILELAQPFESVSALMETILGEGQFGESRWKLSPSRRLYYELKPYIPRGLVRALRSRGMKHDAQFPIRFPIEDRYVRFLWKTAECVLTNKGLMSARFPAFWPERGQFAFALRHDVEAEAGCRAVRELASIDEAHGFRSIFNFVAERYPIDPKLIGELQERGHEVGVHGLRHDGKEFFSKARFMQWAPRANRVLAEWNAVTFCAPLTHRQPEWLQTLNIEYDQSFFDTDPHEPMPGGVMTIFPFFVGKFVEMPYTLIQDHTLGMLMHETSPRLWLEKVDFVRQYHGMALLNAHPDYLLHDTLMDIYVSFLRAMQQRGDYWHAVPREVARWWRRRHDLAVSDVKDWATIERVDRQLVVRV